MNRRSPHFRLGKCGQRIWLVEAVAFDLTELHRQDDGLAIAGSHFVGNIGEQVLGIISQGYLIILLELVDQRIHGLCGGLPVTQRHGDGTGKKKFRLVVTVAPPFTFSSS